MTTPRPKGWRIGLPLTPQVTHPGWAIGLRFAEKSIPDADQLTPGGTLPLAALIVGSGSAPSNEEWMKLEGWAAHRYGLTDLLPADHPYKEVAP